MRKETLPAKIGESTIQFATPAHPRRPPLDILPGGANQRIELFLTHEPDSSALASKITHVACCQSGGNGSRLQDLQRTLKWPDRLRTVGSLPAHGNWQIEEAASPAPYTSEISR